MKKCIILAAIIALTASCGEFKKENSCNCENSIAGSGTKTTGETYYRGSQPVENVVTSNGRIIHN